MSTHKLHLHAPWEEVKEQLKENDFTLSDEDLLYEPGGEQELVERLQKKLNRPTKEVIAYIESISTNRGKAS